MDPKNFHMNTEIEIANLRNNYNYIFNMMQNSFEYLEDKINQNHEDLKNLRNFIEERHYHRRLQLNVTRSGKHLIYNYDARNLKHLIGKNGHRINNITSHYKIRINIPSKSDKPISICPRVDVAANPKLLTKGIQKIMYILNNNYNNNDVA